MSGLVWGLYHLEKLKNLWKYSKTSKTDPNIFQSSTTGWIGVFARPFLGPRTLCLTPLLYTVTQEVVWTQNLVWGVKAKRCTMLLPFNLNILPVYVFRYERVLEPKRVRPWAVCQHRGLLQVQLLPRLQTLTRQCLPRYMSVRRSVRHYSHPMSKLLLCE